MRPLASASAGAARASLAPPLASEARVARPSRGLSIIGRALCLHTALQGRLALHGRDHEPGEAAGAAPGRARLTLYARAPARRQSVVSAVQHLGPGAEGGVPDQAAPSLGEGGAGADGPRAGQEAAILRVSVYDPRSEGRAIGGRCRRGDGRVTTGRLPGGWMSGGCAGEQGGAIRWLDPGWCPALTCLSSAKAIG